MLADKIDDVHAHRRRGLHRRRLVLPDAHRRRAVAARRTGTRTVHLAEILAEHPVSADVRTGRPTFLGLPTAPRGVGQLRRRAAVPGRGARRAGRRAAPAQPAPGHGDDPGQAGDRRRASCPTGSSCGPPARRSRTTSWREPRHLPGAARGSRSPPRGGDRALGARRRRGQRDRHRLVQATGARPRWSRSSRWPPRRSGSTRRSSAAGIAAWETDLAELIVQLGHDRPTHILVPAIHRNRTEIRDIFLREMGAGRPRAGPDLTDDPPALAEAARLHLREKFLRARVAISGANFAVAETGTLAVVESEGNGRMCLTLPRTLITVMGIEKVVPTWRDLEVFLQLLPRSSHRRADEPVHLDVDRRDARRRAAGVPPGAARQRPDGDARRPATAARRCAASAAPPASTSARSTSGPAATRTARSIPGRSARSCRRSCTGVADNPVAAVRLDAVRRLLRRLPGARSTSRRCSSTCGRGWWTRRPRDTGGRRRRRRRCGRSAG